VRAKCNKTTRQTNRDRPPFPVSATRWHGGPRRSEPWVPLLAGRAQAWRDDYEARVRRHRAEIRAETDRRFWSFTIHRTDRSASELLLALQARIGAGANDIGYRSNAGQQRTVTA